MYAKKTYERICQGDIFEEFTYKFTKIFDQSGEIINITLPYAIVLTQDCDLEWDYEKRDSNPNKKLDTNDDKVLQSILICPAYIAEQFRAGDHLKGLGLVMEKWGSNLWRHIVSNQNERFHYLEEDIENKMPNLVVDFKHYYTVPADDIYNITENKYEISISPLFREDISRRFSNYLSRIGLPMRPQQKPEALND